MPRYKNVSCPILKAEGNKSGKRQDIVEHVAFNLIKQAAIYLPLDIKKALH
jgi:hypothetical protein